MEKLPKEVFISIMSYLALDDNLECILVCKKWHDCIRDSNLYRSLKFVDGDQDKFIKAITFFTDQDNIGNTVKRLYLERIDVDSLGAFLLPSLFRV
jgi:hypothetical protein